MAKKISKEEANKQLRYWKSLEASYDAFINHCTDAQTAIDDAISDLNKVGAYMSVCLKIDDEIYRKAKFDKLSSALEKRKEEIDSIIEIASQEKVDVSNWVLYYNQLV